MARKIRGDSVLDNLPVEQFSALRDWFALENLTYADALERLESQFGVITSVGSLTKFFQRHVVGFRTRKARDFAEEVGSVFREADNNFDEATIQLIEQRAFEQASANDASIEDLISLSKILGDTRKLQLQRDKLEIEKRRVSLLEKKAAFADEVKRAAANREGGLTAEDMEEIERRLKIL